MLMNSSRYWFVSWFSILFCLGVVLCLGVDVDLGVVLCLDLAGLLCTIL